MTTDSVDRVDQVLLADGGNAVVRRLRESDRTAVTEFFAAVSDDNLYTRFFTLGRGLIPRHIDHLFERSATVTTYVLLHDDRVLGIADVEACDPTTAEIAFLVADDAHGLGVATLLLERAAADAQEVGVETFVAEVLAINHPMIEVFRDAGFEVELHFDHDEISVRMSTRATETTAAAHARRAVSQAHVPTETHDVRSPT